jgi:hypothetical protein
MPSRANREPGDPPPTALDAALRAIPDHPLPDGLLASCLATVPGAGRRRPRPSGRRRLTALRLAAAALLLATAVGFLQRPRHADAAELLQAVKVAWTTVPASHRVVRTTGPGGTRTEEIWVVRHRGVRKETRVGGDLTGVVVRGPRWEFRWDVPGRTVAAWSTELAAAHEQPGDAGLVFDRRDFEAWAGSHRAEIVAEADTVAGRKVQKVRLKWPGGAGKPQTDTVWFDPESLLPVRQRTEAPDGTVIEAKLDYPSADAVAGDLFTFTMPRDVVLEVNDPDLGRQLYSEGQARKADPTPAAHPKGAER